MIENFKKINLENEMEARRKRLEVISFARRHSVEETREKELFVIHSQIFAKTEEKNPRYVPAELSLARFSLVDGMKEVRHWFPRPGTIPLGYKRACLESSTKGHKIPLDLLKEEEDRAVSVHARYTEDHKILEELMTILNGEHNVFTLPEFETQIGGVLQTLEERSGKKVAGLNILSLPLLMFEIANKPAAVEGTKAAIPFESLADREFEVERFIYQANMNCAWHQEVTDTSHCSSGRVRSWVYSLLDVCCPRYEIPLLPSSHLPPV